MSLAGVFFLIDKYGTQRALERISPPGPAKRVTVTVYQRRAQEAPMIGDVSQYDTQAYVRHGALTGTGFPTPPVKGDRVITGSVVHVVKTVEPMEDGAGNVGAYRLWCRGM